MKLRNQTTQQDLCENIKVADNFKTRLLGLIGTRELMNEGLYIPYSNWIHTFFMSIAIDVIYLDKAGFIKKIDAGLRPWKIPLPVFSARHVVELPAGFAQQNAIKVGDQLYVGH